MARTLSAYVDDELAEKVDNLSEVEDRKTSQLVAAAVELYIKLPAEAHIALRRIAALGTPEDVQRVHREITRKILGEQFRLVQASVVKEMRVPDLDQLRGEDDFLDAAARLTDRAALRDKSKARRKRG